MMPNIKINLTPNIKDIALNIRNATKQDALRIAEIQVHGWRNAYVNIMPQTTLDQLCIEAKTTMWLKII